MQQHISGWRAFDLLLDALANGERITCVNGNVSFFAGKRKVHYKLQTCTYVHALGMHYSKMVKIIIFCV